MRIEVRSRYSNRWETDLHGDKMFEVYLVNDYLQPGWHAEMELPV